MKKFAKLLLAVASAFVLVFTLASCSNVSQSYADKINDAAKNGEPLTYDQVKKDLGDEIVADLVDPLTHSGFISAVKGYNKDMKEEDLEKLDEAINVTFIGGKATAALYVTKEQANALLADAE